MIISILISSSILVILCVITQSITTFFLAYNLIVFLRKGREKFQNIIILMSYTVILLIFSFMIQISYWALFYMIIGEFNDFLTALYFSTVSFATLGYGDIVLSHKWRMVSAIEGITGMLMGGFAASVFFTITLRVFNFQRNKL